jgi:hypothetical protein
MFFAIAAIVISAVVQVISDPRGSTSVARKSLVAQAVFVTHIVLAIGVMKSLNRVSTETEIWGAVAVAGWIALGCLALVRGSPQLKKTPAMLVSVGWPDLLALAAVITGVANALRSE